MPLTKMEHYLVLTDDIDATRDFYVQALVSCPVSYRHMYCYRPGYHRNGRDRDGNGSSKSGTDLERS
jgi:hypothetical protein